VHPALVATDDEIRERRLSCGGKWGSTVCGVVFHA
jgi:hypothetical protein